MSDGQAYYDGLIGQGYTPEQATQYTQQYYAGFEPAVAQVAPVADFQFEQAHVAEVAQEHGVNPTQLVDTARHFDANADGILQQSELETTAMQMTSTVAPTAPAPMAAPMAAAPMAAPMAAAPMAAPPGMAAPMMAGAPMGGMGMMPAPAAAASGGGPLGFVAVACIVLTLVFSVMGLFMDSWLIAESDSEEGEGVSMGLTSITLDCSGVNESSKATCSSLSWIFLQEDMEGAEAPDDVPVSNSGSIDDYCSNLESWVEGFGGTIDDDDKEKFQTCYDTASAGSTGGYILWGATIAALAGVVLIAFNIFGIGALPVDTQKFGFIAGVAAGALAGIAVLIWYLMLPSEGDMSAGMNVWLTITGAVSGIAAGVLTKLKGNPSA